MKTPRVTLARWGATSNPNAVDPAIRRPGRLEKEVGIGMPDLDDRVGILRIYLERVPLSPKCVCSTSAGNPTIEIATSRPAAAAAGESAQTAPCARSASAFTGVRVCTARSCPAASK